jgi:hypothetical protein
MRLPPPQRAAVSGVMPDAARRDQHHIAVHQSISRDIVPGVAT